ncbi:hypothetical protein UFOVP641_39 [uncultured Caudovirales phage]|uniref:Uncharacterized protein n=1 Tax=uncultured Caudovirales phage TaxID=2100421 RepID=A0A6J5N4A6_9CAUD|nr:hypothetical protein UFOVP641_39 [uncultured Caudovirales phage]
MSNPSLRELVAINLIESLQTIDDPRPVLITRDPFDVEKLAITQFPALLVQQTTENRETISMGSSNVGRRQGVMEFEIRGFVRGVELDTRRNELIAAVEDAVDLDRYRALRTNGVTDTQVRSIEIISRLQPLAEFLMTIDVTYNYARGQL